MRPATIMRPNGAALALLLALHVRPTASAVVTAFTDATCTIVSLGSQRSP
jgi:hypothetical protein